jgi:hypothetical protein
MGDYFDMVTCIDCGSRRQVSRNEWNRAARPRCLACGGPVEISVAANEQRLNRQNLAKDLSKKRSKNGQGEVVS